MAYEQAPSTQDIRSSMQRRGGRPGKIEKAKDPRLAMGRLLRYLAPYGLSLCLVAGFVLIYSLLGLGGPYLMGVAIDRFIGGKDAAGLARTAGLMLAAYAFSNLFQVAANWMMARISQGALRNLRGDLFAHLQTLSMGFFDTHAAGGLMSRLTSDIDAINQAVSQNVTSLLASVLSISGILVAMFVLDMWLALASVLVVPIMFAFTEFVARYTRRGFRALQKHLGELNSVMEEAITGQKVVRAFRRNESVIDAFRRCNGQVFRAAVWANSYAFLLMPLTNVLGNFFVIVLAGLGGWLALQGLVSVGIIATFINYAQNFISPLRQLANMYNAIQAALAGAERVFEIIDTPSEADDAPDAETPEAIRGDVRFDRVNFGYRAGTPIIKDMTFEARAGETLALVGPTGAGKTTLINLLTRFYEIDGGSITIDGKEIRSIRKADLRRRLGIVLQDTFLFSGTVLENIRYGRLKATDEECIA
ncbi:MAG TPA: multidrug ABC transporter ATP-binding protein, partial [Candidatus Omnitrophica bacterium]|nr:multidrug ABC transporter ATP-binding protein [Candidatus Omnitrophota bacterium]